jgi:hypothetical protein
MGRTVRTSHIKWISLSENVDVFNVFTILHKDVHFSWYSYQFVHPCSIVRRHRRIHRSAVAPVPVSVLKNPFFWKDTLFGFFNWPWVFGFVVQEFYETKWVFWVQTHGFSSTWWVFGFVARPACTVLLSTVLEYRYVRKVRSDWCDIWHDIWHT